MISRYSNPLILVKYIFYQTHSQGWTFPCRGLYLSFFGKKMGETWNSFLKKQGYEIHFWRNRDTKWHMGMGIPIPYHCFLFSSLLHSTITSTISYLLYYTVRTTMGNTDGTGGWWTDQSGTLLHHPEQSAVNLPIRIPCRWQQWSLCLRARGSEGRRSQGDMEAEGEVWMETRVRVWDIEQQKGANLIQKVKD